MTTAIVNLKEPPPMDTQPPLILIPSISTTAEIASRIRRRAFNSGNARTAIRLLALADEVPSMHLPNGARILMHIGTPPPRNTETPALRRLRRKKRWLDMARPLTRHPRLLESIADVLPRARNRPGARLREDLRLDDAEIAALATALEEAFAIHIAAADRADWETLNDVTDTIAAAQYCEPA